MENEINEIYHQLGSLKAEVALLRKIVITLDPEKGQSLIDEVEFKKEKKKFLEDCAGKSPILKEKINQIIGK